MTNAQDGEILKGAIYTATCWRNAKMLGGDPYEVCNILLAEIERLHATTADQQGDTASAAWTEDDRREQEYFDRWPNENAQQGAAQAQAGAAPALMRGAVGSVASNADGEIRVNWMRPERVEAGTLLYVIDRAAMAAPATSGGESK